jgi:hypothetical protein
MLHPTRLSLFTLLMSGATPQAAPGNRKRVEGDTSQVCVWRAELGRSIALRC